VEQHYAIAVYFMKGQYIPVCYCKREQEIFGNRVSQKFGALLRSL